MKIRALSSFSHPQEGARAQGLDTKRRCIPMHSHRRATQTRLLRLAHAVKCRRQRSPCRRQQLRREALPPCALLHRVQASGRENLNRLKLVLVSAGCARYSLMGKNKKFVPHFSTVNAEREPSPAGLQLVVVARGRADLCGSLFGTTSYLFPRGSRFVVDREFQDEDDPGDVRHRRTYVRPVC